MARKLIKRHFESRRQDQEKSANWGSYGHVTCQHVLLWSTLYAAASRTYLIATAAITISILPPVAVLLVACLVTFVYLIAHNVAASYHRQPFGDTSECCKVAGTVAKVALRVAITLWMGGCGTIILFTAARQPFCPTFGDNHGIASIDSGAACFVHRASVATSLLALLSTVTLFTFTIRVSEPYRCHLLGITKDPQLLPMALVCDKKGNPIFSEMSFKCRSSTSLSTATLVAKQASEKDDYGMYPARPEKAYGLGISTPKRSAAAFLTPRPSLGSIRKHTLSGPVPPPCSPLPPLPAYFPGKHYRASSSMHRTPFQPHHPFRAPSKPRTGSVLTAPSCHGLAAPNMQIFNKSAESLSSVYSRSVSGEKSPLVRPPGLLAAFSRSSSSNSVPTLRTRPSPLEAMRRVSQSNTILLLDEEPRTSTESFDIDDATTLQARLPSVKSVGTLGDVAFWAPPSRDDGSRTTPPRSWGSREDVLGSCLVAPLAMRKVKNEAPKVRAEQHRW